MRSMKELVIWTIVVSLMLGLLLGGTLYAADTPDSCVPMVDLVDKTGVIEAPAGSYAANITIDNGDNFHTCAWYPAVANGTYTWNPAYGPVCSVDYAKVTVEAWDVDHPADDEIDEVYLNGLYLGNLTGSSNTTSNSTFILDSTQIDTIFGAASYPLALNVEILIDTVTQFDWCVQVDTIYIDIEYETCPVVFPLCAGQTMDVGNVTVTDDGAGNLTVRYQTSGDWVMTETHLSVVGNETDFPTTKINKNGKGGNPKVGQFANQTEHDPGVNDFSYTVDISQLDPDREYGELVTLAIAAHAVVYNTVTQVEETAWGDGCEGTSFPGSNWATWFTYQTCLDCPIEGEAYWEEAGYYDPYERMDFSIPTACGDVTGEFNWMWSATIAIPDPEYAVYGEITDVSVSNGNVTFSGTVISSYGYMGMGPAEFSVTVIDGGVSGDFFSLAWDSDPFFERVGSEVTVTFCP